MVTLCSMVRLPKVDIFSRGFRIFSLFGMIAVLVILGGKTFKITQISALDPIEQLEQEKNDLAKLLKLSADATAPLEKEVQGLDARIQKARSGILAAQNQTKEVAKTIQDRELKLAVQYKIFTQRVASRYKRQAWDSPLLVFLNGTDASVLTRDLTYRQSIEQQDNRIIREFGTEIKDLETERKNLEVTQKRLASLQKELDSQAEFFRKEIQGAKAYQTQLAGQIASLTAKQQDILNARSGSFTTAVGDVPLADDFNASIGFKAQAPSNSFAVFSFGGFTHRNGMSQYGARARAEAGQSVEEILKAYYPNAELKKDYPVPDTIEVQGHGRMSFEGKYLRGIAEMPTSWNINAQKAQAVAARTFAMRHTSNGQKSICTTEACQVYRNSDRGGEWNKAVEETKGWVLVQDGQPVSAQYASTHGGYSNTAGWDTTDKAGGGDWSSRAWESKAKSPWFYKAWYTQAYSVNSGKCGRSHPWLSQEEFSDIINAWLVRKNPNGADVNRIQPVTINQCSVGGSGGNPYSMEELRNFANGSGGAVTQVNSVSVSHSGNAQTSTVILETNRGRLEIPGSDFKTTFNLRAPGYLSIPQKSFAFFNIEHKQ
jgi:peptidoglycan hydrolase CwlO-like protein